MEAFRNACGKKGFLSEGLRTLQPAATRPVYEHKTTLSPDAKVRLFCLRLVSELRPIRSTDNHHQQPARMLFLLLPHVLFNVFNGGVINLGKRLYVFIRHVWAQIYR